MEVDSGAHDATSCLLENTDMVAAGFQLEHDAEIPTHHQLQTLQFSGRVISNF